MYSVIYKHLAPHTILYNYSIFTPAYLLLFLFTCRICAASNFLPPVEGVRFSTPFLLAFPLCTLLLNYEKVVKAMTLKFAQQTLAGNYNTHNGKVEKIKKKSLNKYFRKLLAVLYLVWKVLQSDLSITYVAIPKAQF